jgi:hypothetical protein
MARILRRLSIDSVDSVDRGAGQNCVVVLTKRHEEESHMSKSSRCPTCNQKLPDDYEPDEDDVTEKRLDPDVIMKSAVTSADSIIADFRKRMPNASEAQVMSAATSSREFMQLHMDEKLARQRAMGNI